MKKYLKFIALSALSFALLLSGCSTKTETEGTNEVVTTENGIYINEKYNNEKMTTVAGEEVTIEGNNYVATDPTLGFGLNLEGKLGQLLFDDAVASGFVGENNMCIYFTSQKGIDEAAKSFENMADMTEEEYAQVQANVQAETVAAVGIYRLDDGEENSERYTIFSQAFSGSEEVAKYNGSTYYFKYNDDFSALTLTDEEKTTVEELINEYEKIKENIIIFPPEEADDTGNASSPYSGVSLKDIETTDLNGNAVTGDIFADYDITMVNIWATWCGPCTEEMPDLAEVYKNLPENVNLIGICEDGDSQRDLAKEILEASGAEFTVLLRSDSVNNAIMNSIYSLPTTIFVDKEGNIVGTTLTGAPRDGVYEHYMKYINEALEEVNG